MIRLKSLTLKGFRSFMDETTVTFPDSGLVLLDGDSGAGKSTILLAIAYALDIAPSEYTGTELQSWSGEPLQVLLGLEKDGVPITIARGKKTFIQFGDEKPRTGSAAWTEGLHQLFGVTPTVLSSLVYRAQDTAGTFLSMSDPDKKEFLAELLSLNAIEEAAEKAREAGDALKVPVEVAQQESVRILQEIEVVQKEETPDAPATRVALSHLGYTRATFDEALLRGLLRDVTGREGLALDSYNRQASLVQEAVQKVQTFALDCQLAQAAKAGELEQKLFELRQAQNRLQSEQNSRRVVFDAERANLARKHTELWSNLQGARGAEADVRAIKGRLQTLREGKCFTCQQPYVADEQIAALEDLLARATALFEQVPALEFEYRNVNQALNSMTLANDPRIEEARKIELGLVESIATLKSPHLADPRFATLQADARLAENELRRRQNDLETIRREKDQYERDLQQLERAKADRAARLERLQKRLNESQEKHWALSAQLAQETDFALALGRSGFLGAIFDEVLAEIAVETNQRLAKLTNVRHVTVKFDSEYETKGKKTRRVIVPVVSVGGVTAKYRTGLSGGMKSSCDQAVDLATRQVVSRRSGCKPGWLALDEVFNGQPPATKEAAMEVLQEFARESLVLVVDHSTEFKESFTKVIRVDIRNGRSYVDS
jgi:DNA repair exonuclease SbcCD ATPase subunit